MDRRRLLLFGLLGIAAWLAFFGDRTPEDRASSGIVQPAMPARAGRGSAALPAPQASAGTPAGRAGQGAGQDLPVPEVAALIPRDQLIPGRAGNDPERDLFPSLNWVPPPVVPAMPDKPPPPMAPPLPFVYLGKKFESGQWEIYLGRGEDVFIAREGVTIDGQYRVKGISPPRATLVYLPLKQVQTMDIGGGE